ncbi:NlpC/P60 family protein [Enterovibrio makurazakiensis]|uniref:NlpC/P60 family protein n=1 Tax=Enterovibrio gelatinilyticus TaxID=2899819 RepID=A0ABT5QVV4_9GAMM|nr:NlpC/P60 family protein [Enterovibrio sp. ZSDZ42]MDD1792158.1 NlpC/P60 family protein [Enterovibrio sp. ZSDZ42]
MRTLITCNAIALACMSLIGCESTQSDHASSSTGSFYNTNRPNSLAPVANPEQPFNLALIQYFEEWQGTPYRWGGASKRGIDCSAFTQQAYQAVFQHSLPRTTRQQVTKGSKTSLKSASFGDLIFFKTGSQRYHVGIYIGDRQFMHASSSKGVMISTLDNPYWSARIWQIRNYLP